MIVFGHFFQSSQPGFDHRLGVIFVFFFEF